MMGNIYPSESKLPLTSIDSQKQWKFWREYPDISQKQKLKGLLWVIKLLPSIAGTCWDTWSSSTPSTVMPQHGAQHGWGCPAQLGPAGEKIKRPLVTSAKKKKKIINRGGEGGRHATTGKTNGVWLQNTENSAGKGDCRRVRLSKNVLMQGWAGASSKQGWSSNGASTRDHGHRRASCPDHFNETWGPFGGDLSLSEGA